MTRVILTSLCLACWGAIAHGANVPSLYWSEAGGVMRSGLDGSQIEDVADGFEVGGLALDRSYDRLFFSDILPLGGPGPAGSIFGGTADGGGMAAIVSQLPAPTALALDRVGQNVFWADRDERTISFASYAGGEPKTILPQQDSIADIAGLAIDPWKQKLYFSYVNPLIDSLTPGSIARMNFDGSELEIVVEGLVSPQGVAVDFVRDKIYWADQIFLMSGIISAANLDGSGREKVASGMSHPRGLALDPFVNQLYWADFGTGAIQTHTPFVEAVDIVTGRNAPVAIGLLYHSGLAGDTNDDGLVDLADLNNVRNHFGEQSAVGDADLDGDVDLDDLNSVRNHFGERFLPPDAVAAVPEPAGFALGAIAGLAALLIRTRKKPTKGPAKTSGRR